MKSLTFRAFCRFFIEHPVYRVIRYLYPLESALVKVLNKTSGGVCLMLVNMLPGLYSGREICSRCSKRCIKQSGIQYFN